MGAFNTCCLDVLGIGIGNLLQYQEVLGLQPHPLPQFRPLPLRIHRHWHSSRLHLASPAAPRLTSPSRHSTPAAPHHLRLWQRPTLHAAPTPRAAPVPIQRGAGGVGELRPGPTSRGWRKKAPPPVWSGVERRRRWSILKCHGMNIQTRIGIH